MSPDPSAVSGFGGEMFTLIVDGLVQAAAVGFVGMVGRWLYVHFVLPRWRAGQTNSRNLNRTKWIVYREGKQVGTAHIRQTGERLSADVELEGSNRKFRYFGIIRSDMIRMDWTEVGWAKLNFGSLNLKVSSDQRRLSGFTTFVHRDEGKVVSRATDWARESDWRAPKISGQWLLASATAGPHCSDGPILPIWRLSAGVGSVSSRRRMTSRGTPPPGSLG